MSDIDHGLLDEWVQFFRNYYLDDIREIAAKPNDLQSLWIDHTDIFRYNPGLADDLLEQPDAVLSNAEEAVDMVDVPIDADLSHVTVRVTGLPDEHIIGPGEVRKDHGGEFVGIRGNLERVTTSDDMPRRLVYQCDRCDTTVPISQSPSSNELQEPYECPSCERQGPFAVKPNAEESKWSDYAKVRVQSRPDTEGEGKITGYVLDDLIDVGGEAGLIDRAGEPVIVYGKIERVQKNGRNENNLLFEHFLQVNSIEFVRSEETVDIQEHKEEFKQLAQRTDAVDLFAQSIAPNLHATDAWEAAFEFAVAYLFGAPRIDLPNGPTYRGDLHFLIISDFGMGKSDFSEDIAAYSPKAISKSTTALSSGVGLTAAAVKDDFGEGQWTIKPGLLVQANGGHLILDEIDKGPEELTDMNDALEGKQQVDVEKAGKSATYDSRTGLLALGNPVDGRFDPNAAVSEEIGIAESLLSRFDGIVTMRDTEDTEQDSNVAEAYGKAYTEAQQTQYGTNDELDYLDREVPIDVGQAWVKYAREEVNPILTYEQFEELKDWYARDVRQLNNDHASGDGEDMPVPATVRVLGAAVKMSIAFARVRLQDEVHQQQIERAKKLGKRLVKQNWNGERFDATKNMGTSQKDRIQAIVSECGGETLTVSEVAGRVRRDFDEVRNDLQRMEGRQAESVANNRYKIKEVE